MGLKGLKESYICSTWWCIT